MKRCRRLALGALIAVIAIAGVTFAACEGPTGPQGEPGLDGPQGPGGPGGLPGPGTPIRNVYFIPWNSDWDGGEDISVALIALLNRLIEAGDLEDYAVAVNVHGGEAMLTGADRTNPAHWTPSGLFLPYTVIEGFLDYVDSISDSMAVVETDVAYGVPFFGGTPTIRFGATHSAMLANHFPNWDTVVLDYDGAVGGTLINDMPGTRGHIEVPVPMGRRIEYALIGEGLEDFDFVINLSHFTGHSMSGFGGTIKNMGLGLSSIQGKMLAHTGGANPFSWGGGLGTAAFQEALSEVALAVREFMEGNILHITVVNNLSKDCDCWSGIAAGGGGQASPDIYCVGILASWDPVAVDQAAMNLIMEANRTQYRRTTSLEHMLGVDGLPSLISGPVLARAQAMGVRPEGAGSSLLGYFANTNGQWKLDWGQRIGLGSVHYRLVTLELP